MKEEISFGDIILLEENNGNCILTTVSLIYGKIFGLTYTDKPERKIKNGLIVEEHTTGFSASVNTLFYSPKSLKNRGRYQILTRSQKDIIVKKNETYNDFGRTGVLIKPLLHPVEIKIISTEKSLEKNNYQSKLINVLGNKFYLNTMILPVTM